MKKIIYSAVIAGMAILAACNKQIDAIHPLDKISQQGEFSTLAGIIQATNGNYLNLTNTAGENPNGNDLEMDMHNICEFRGNNVTLARVSLLTPDEKDAYTYTNSAGDEHVGYTKLFWRGSYQLIIGINIALEGIEAFKKDQFASLSPGDKNKLLHAEGENYFLRALAYFNLVRVYGMPYYQNAQTNLGVMLKTTGDPKDIPGRSTVKQTYDLIVQDLQQAALLMNGTGNLPNTFANVGAAWALLSRAYLYMGGTFTSPDNTYNKLCISYADSAINSGLYQLLQGQDYINLFAPDLNGTIRKNINGNSEVIFAYDHSNRIGYADWFYHYDGDYFGTIFTGGFYPSKSFLDLIAPGDLRNNFLLKNATTGQIEATKYLVLPNAWQCNAPYIYLRLAEVYLNRAEAEVKAGDNTAALNDLNVIHTRAGLTPLTGLTGQGLFNAILMERRMELAFEGHNSFDDFRNGLPMVRPSEDTGGQPFIIQPTDPKVVMRIPQDDINTNPKLKQNDQ